MTMRDDKQTDRTRTTALVIISCSAALVVLFLACALWSYYHPYQAINETTFSAYPEMVLHESKIVSWSDAVKQYGEAAVLDMPLFEAEVAMSYQSSKFAPFGIAPYLDFKLQVYVPDEVAKAYSNKDIASAISAELMAIRAAETDAALAQQAAHAIVGIRRGLNVSWSVIYNDGFVKLLALVGLPICTAGVLFGSIVLIYRQWVRRRRRMRRECEGCGYPLASGVAMCSECGMPSANDARGR